MKPWKLTTSVCDTYWTEPAGWQVPATKDDEKERQNNIDKTGRVKMQPLEVYGKKMKSYYQICWLLVPSIIHQYYKVPVTSFISFAYRWHQEVAV